VLHYHMADHCCFCDVRRPMGGTNHLVLGGGANWIEFCPSCGEKETLHNPDLGITVTVAELYRATSEGREPKPAPAHLCAAHGKPVKEEDNFGSLANIL
jgi:hypothetical protein